MGLSVCRPVQSTCAASPSPASSWLPRPVRRTRWTQTAQYTETTYTANLMDLYSSVGMYWGSDMCRSLLQDSSGNCVCVCVFRSVCPLWGSWLPPAAVAVLHQRSWGWRGSSWTNWTGICTPPQHWTSCTSYVRHTLTVPYFQGPFLKYPLSISSCWSSLNYWSLVTYVWSVTPGGKKTSLPLFPQFFSLHHFWFSY